MLLHILMPDGSKFYGHEINRRFGVFHFDDIVKQNQIIKLLETEEALTKYQRDRLTEYQKLNQFELQFNDLINGTTTWIDTINDIKAKYPKPQ